jgi:hypothetical protein
MAFINRSKKKILFLSSTSHHNDDGQVDIILSPELYWVRLFTIPVNNTKDALSVVPTFFDDFLNILDYKFYAIKQTNNKYLCFAYNESKIIDLIKQSNINFNNISKIYFAQNEFHKLNNVKLANEYFGYQNNILVKYPLNLIDKNSFRTFNLSSQNLSKYSISIYKTSKYLDVKSIYTLSIVFIFISILNFSKIININSQISIININQKRIQKEYKLLPTKLQTRSIIKKLNRIKNRQENIRKSLEIALLESKNKQLKVISLSNGRIVYE